MLGVCSFDGEQVWRRYRSEKLKVWWDVELVKSTDGIKMW